MKNNGFSNYCETIVVPSKHDRTAWLKGGNYKCAQPPSRPPSGKPSRIILLGAPGVGKGTQADLICERLGACHLSTGDVFRAASRADGPELSPVMQNALDYMRSGNLIPDETVLNMVGERLRCLNCSGGFLLDGFPRTVAQAKALDQLLESNHVELTAVYNYELAIDKIVSRISGRRTCPDCKAVYHLSTRKPINEGRCDACGGLLIQREDDRPEAVKVRMEAYEKSTRPLIEFYQERGLLITIEAEGSPEEIYQRTQNASKAL